MAMLTRLRSLSCDAGSNFTYSLLGRSKAGSSLSMEDYHGVNAFGMVDARAVHGHGCFRLCITDGWDETRYAIASRVTGSTGHDGRTFPYGA